MSLSCLCDLSWDTGWLWNWGMDMFNTCKQTIQYIERKIVSKGICINYSSTLCMFWPSHAAVLAPSHTFWAAFRPPRMMVPVTVHLRLKLASFRMAVCTSSGLQGHWKATLAWEFVKWKAVAPLSTASRSMSRICGHAMGRLVCGESRYTSKCLIAWTKVIVMASDGCCNRTAFRKRQAGTELPFFMT